MLELDTRLIQYDETPPTDRPTLLTKLFENADELMIVQQFLEDPFARPLLEFMLLDAVPYEDFVRLRDNGLAEVYGDFATYVPVARGLCFPSPKVTEAARHYKVVATPGRTAEALIEGLVLAYRARTTGQGIVAGRTTLEEWLDTCDEGALSCVVDPTTGGRLDAWGPNLEHYGDLICPSYRERLIARRACDEVAMPMAHSQIVHDSGLPPT